MAGQVHVQLPTALVGPVRAALQAQGLSPLIIGDDGTLSPAFFVSAAYDTAEFRSRLLSLPTIDLGSAIDPNAPVNPLVKFLRPTLILKGRAGINVIAPFGEAAAWEGWVGLAVMLAGVAGLGYLLGRSRCVR